jgi:hypothetical protein
VKSFLRRLTGWVCLLLVGSVGVDDVRCLGESDPATVRANESLVPRKVAVLVLTRERSEGECEKYVADERGLSYPPTVEVATDEDSKRWRSVDGGCEGEGSSSGIGSSPYPISVQSDSPDAVESGRLVLLPLLLLPLPLMLRGGITGPVGPAPGLARGLRVWVVN